MKKLNKKGFTLVELLAVIVVLALLMVVAASSIGSALSNAKKNTLKTEAQKIITNVYQNAYSQYMLNSNIGQLTGYDMNQDGTVAANEYPTSITSGTDIVGYNIKGIDGKYKFFVNVDTKGNIKAYCVNYNETELSITETDISTTGAYTISDTNATIKEGSCSIVTTKLNGKS